MKTYRKCRGFRKSGFFRIHNFLIYGPILIILVSIALSCKDLSIHIKKTHLYVEINDMEAHRYQDLKKSVNFRILQFLPEEPPYLKCKFFLSWKVYRNTYKMTYRP